MGKVLLTIIVFPLFSAISPVQHNLSYSVPFLLSQLLIPSNAVPMTDRITLDAAGLTIIN
jgi:hypothetical protein